jgi:hypothetical protein
MLPPLGHKSASSHCTADEPTLAGSESRWQWPRGKRQEPKGKSQEARGSWLQSLKDSGTIGWLLAFASRLLALGF